MALRGGYRPAAVELDGTTGNATVTTDASGQKIITINGASGGENWSGSITFTVTITQEGCTAWSRVQKLAY